MLSMNIGSMADFGNNNLVIGQSLVYVISDSYQDVWMANIQGNLRIFFLLFFLYCLLYKKYTGKFSPATRVF